jgi:hypothetical protein
MNKIKPGLSIKDRLLLKDTDVCAYYKKPQFKTLEH